MMVNVSDARRESRSRKSIRGIHHHKLEAWEFAHRVFIKVFVSHTPTRTSSDKSICIKQKQYKTPDIEKFLPVLSKLVIEEQKFL